MMGIEHRPLQPNPPELELVNVLEFGKSLKERLQMEINSLADKQDKLASKAKWIEVASKVSMLVLGAMALGGWMSMLHSTLKIGYGVAILTIGLTSAMAIGALDGHLRNGIYTELKKLNDEERAYQRYISYGQEIECLNADTKDLLYRVKLIRPLKQLGFIAHKIKKHSSVDELELVYPHDRYEPNKDFFENVKEYLNYLYQHEQQLGELKFYMEWAQSTKQTT